jgi:hypothetical protein
MKTYYAPTFIDESRTHPDKKGNSRPTGKLKGFVMTRRFSLTPKGKIRAERGVVPFQWSEDTEEAKAEALSKVIEGMEEISELDANPPLIFIPQNIQL